MSAEDMKIIENLIATLYVEKLPKEDDVNNDIQRFRAIYPLTEEEAMQLLHRLHARLRIDMDIGAAITEDHQSWFPARKADIEPYYWKRYAQYIGNNGWPFKVINTLDRVTDEIIDLIGDPSKTTIWSRRGLVMGDVQSGKTSTYTALCCKAADVGYKLIILLTGSIESLRRQTQERLDTGFVGLDSAGLLTKQRKTREVGVGLLNRQRQAAVFTSTTSDFRTGLINSLGFRINTFNEPIWVVIKKNKRILENLENWLRSFNANNSGKIDTPMLLIDDEADSASINTSPNSDDPTAINERIRLLLHLFSRSSYIGFTATPFANIFIDPDSECDMLGDDLFPRHFIYALEAPDNHMGAQRIFGDDTDVDCLREIDDADKIFPTRHTKTSNVEALPDILLEALRVFIIANAIRDLRKEGRTHRSMLVNVSRFTDVQDKVRELLDITLREMNREIRNYSQLKPDEACRFSAIAALKNTWEQDFNNTGFSWQDIQCSLLHAASPIEVRSVNQRSGAASLDYSSYRDTGLRVVAVGGNSLSRGLTLEGLCVSYFLRNSQMYDTLLQMGRWFGYRDGYDDLCRIWLTDEAIHWYRHISLATDELRGEIRRMKSFNLTPKDFGLKVRAHPDSLIVTARNKMRTAKDIEQIISVSGQGLETARLHMGDNFVHTNSLAAEKLLNDFRTSKIVSAESSWKNTIWRDVHKKYVVNFLRSFISHPLNITFQTDDLASFLENTNEPKLQNWDVVIPNGSEPSENFAWIAYRPQKRRVVISKETKSILVSGDKRRVGSRGIEKEGISTEIVQQIKEQYGDNNVPDKAYRARRHKPLLLLHLIKPYVKKEEMEKYDTGSDTLVAVGLSFPEFDDRSDAQRVRYRINLVEWRNIFMDEADDEMVGDDDTV
ncbi:Z1 domain-containing protein [Candidatus Magnetominusculus dajiuhuensis]|uniref:Z1 domain-containing protein n=1 Tax=Candidatus Magnetominusculus dajiuhuensis TaxID=3137712 RepID=UPI003B42EE88